ncbi:MAG TPA: hypothetical protein PLJ60_00420 [Chryseolinea sp.]|nr:hypothetical protein [Chryseolinea sp.]HPM28770.1 hypothetical protein [Chryseolinea sp.]
MSNLKQHPIQKIVPFLPWAEKGLLLALLIGLSLTYFKTDSHGLIQISLIGLAVVFFLYAYKPLEIQYKEDEILGFKELLSLNIAPKILWIGSASTTVGIMFYILENPWYKQQLLIGILVIGAATLIVAFAFVSETKHIKVITPVLFRSIPVLLAGIFLFLK